MRRFGSACRFTNAPPRAPTAWRADCTLSFEQVGECIRMRRSQWPHPGVRRHNRWLDLGLAALLGAILIGQAVELTSPSAPAPWARAAAR